MKLYALLLLFILAGVCAFAALNWSVFTMPADLSLGLMPVQLPLGLLMLGLLAVVTVLFFVFAVYLQASALLEFRRLSRDLQASRELAEKSEASRFSELRGALEAEMQKLANLDAELKSTVLARGDQLNNELRSTIEQTGNTLAAYIGELEDRLEKKIRTPPAAV